MQFATIRETAKTLGVPVFAVRRLVKEGIAPGFFAGTRFYCDVERLTSMLATSHGKLEKAAETVAAESKETP